MIWIYTTKEKEFVATDATSLTQLMGVARNQWVWVDIFDPNEKELEIISEIIGNEPDLVEKFNKLIKNPFDAHLIACDVCNYEKVNDFTIITIPSIDFEEQLIVYPIVLGTKKKMIITWGGEGQNHSRIIKKTIKRLREGVEDEQALNSSLVISVLFHEIAIKNSNMLLRIREKIDHIEEQALKNEGKDPIRSIFSLKKTLSTLYRLMIEEKDFMFDISKSVIPLIKLNEKSKPIVDEAIAIIDREIDFIDSYTRALESILTLKDLASIHRVESSINYLTIVLVIGTVILIALEILAALEIH
jgi:Mg2+ and Co2+ transporter CorA